MAPKGFPGVGLWKLVSYEAQADDGSIFYPLGRNVVGRVGYDAGGNVWVQIAAADRPPFAVNDRYKGTPEEIRTAMEGYSAYFGAYDFDDGQKTVTHRIACCLYPNWMGTAQLRYYEISGERLILRTPRLRIKGKDVVETLVWERLTKG